MCRFLILPMLLVGAGCHHLNRTGDSACGEIAGPPDCPQVETRCPEEIRVKAPPQRIVINRQREERQPVGGAPAQELMLVPRTVYVPYVPIAPTAPLRMGAPPEPPRPPLGTAPCPPMESPACPSPDMSRALKEVDELNARLHRIECALQNLCPPQGVSAVPAAPALSTPERADDRSLVIPATRTEASSPRR